MSATQDGPLRFVTLDRPLGEASDLPIFRGEVRYQPLVTTDESELLRATLVSFRPEARTVWHHHEGDQILICTSGHGIVATDEQELQIRAGDVVFVPVGTRHWHGAAPGTYMSHISILAPGEEILHDD